MTDKSESQSEQLPEAKITSQDGQPAVELPNGERFVLNVYLNRIAEPVNENIEFDTEVCSDDYSWWHLTTEQDIDVEIMPQLASDGAGSRNENMTRGDHDVSDAIAGIEQVEDKLAALVRESQRSAEGSSETPVIQTEKINELREQLTESRAAIVDRLVEEEFKKYQE